MEAIPTGFFIISQIFNPPPDQFLIWLPTVDFDCCQALFRKEPHGYL
jgi:hypothetical protein